MPGFVPKRHYIGGHQLTSPLVTSCVTAGDYYKIGGTWADGCSHGFVSDGAGRLTFVGEDGTNCLLVGVSDLSTNKVCRVIYSAYINGVIVPNASTPTDFTSANKIGNIAITKIVSFDKGDYFEVWVMSDTSNTDITHNTLYLSFIGNR
jgi:hypothetical protein